MQPTVEMARTDDAPSSTAAGGPPAGAGAHATTRGRRLLVVRAFATEERDGVRGSAEIKPAMGLGEP